MKKVTLRKEEGKRSALHVVSLLVLVGLIIVPIAYEFTGNTSQPASEKKSLLPTGLQVYTIAQAAEVWPKILEASINPPDVHVGDTQAIEVTIESRSSVTEVYADIETDRDTVRVPLKYVGIAGEVKNPLAGIINTGSESVIQKAEASETTKGRYRGEWVVHDTHDKVYHTTIVAKAGEDQSSVVMAWSDACSIPAGGSFTLSSPCTISAVDGVDNGSITINSSLTLNANFGFNSGFSFIVGSGSIAVCTGCSILKTNIWQIDADADGYPAAATMYLQSASPNNGRRRYLLNTTIDTNDAYYSLTNSPGGGATLVAQWDFEEGGGTTVSDSSGYGNNGTVAADAKGVAAKAWTTDNLGNGGYDFTEAYMTVPDSSSLSLVGDLSISFVWINNTDGTDPCPNANHPIKKGNGTAPDEFTLELECGSVITGYASVDPTSWGFIGETLTSNGDWEKWLDDTYGLNYGSWHMVTITRNVSETKVYEDTNLIYTGAGYASTGNDSTDQFKLGPFGGPNVTIGGFRLYSGALTQSDVNTIWYEQF